MDTGPQKARKTNPRYYANIFSIITFGWTLETFKLGYRRDIKDNDLCAPLPEHKSSILGDAVQDAWHRETERCGRRGDGSAPSLWQVLLRVFGCELMLYGLILAAMEFIIRLLQPLFLGFLLRYYSPLQDATTETYETANNTYISRLLDYENPEGRISWGEAIFFSFAVVFCSAINIMVQHPFMMGAMHIGMKMRVGICSLIYRKAMKISSQAMSESSAGLVVNLLANDVNRFDTGPLFAHYLWIAPLETVVVMVYLYREMGVAAIFGSLFIFAVIPFQIYLGTQTAKYRLATAIKSDERVRLMKEIILGVEVIKMYSWEEPFRNVIASVRREEIGYISKCSYIRGVIMSFIMFTSRFGIFLCTLFYVVRMHRINVETIFILTSYYNITKQTMTLYFPQAVGQIAELKVAVRRIRDYLLTEECELAPEIKIEPIVLRVSNDSNLSTIVEDTKEMQSKISTELQSNVIGESKKTDEEKRDIIQFENAGSRWLKGGMNNIENITVKMKEGKLITIIGAVGSGKSTMLHMLLRELPCTEGSLKVEGTISYASQEPWLFVGSVRQNILFGQPFVKSRYMEVCKVCALERDLSLFPHGDKTIVGERGVSLSGGQRARIALARAVYKEANIYLLDDPLSAVDTQVAKHIFENCISKYLSDKTVVLVTHQVQFIKSVDQIVVLSKGQILAEGDYVTLKELNLEIIREMKDNVREVRESESLPALRSASSKTSFVSLRRLSMLLEGNADESPQVEFQSTGRVRGSVYRDYFLSGAGACFALAVLLLFVLSQVAASAGDYWITLWSRQEDQLTGDSTVDQIFWSEQTIQRSEYIYIYGSITVTTIILALARAFMFFKLCMKSSICLHDSMFNCISRSPMSFFHANPSGRILNRFSKDMGAVDELLPQAMIDCFQIMLNLIGVSVVILLLDITLLVPMVTAVVIFYILRIVYIRTTGAVKRLEGITRSPVFNHLNATVLGLATIRSFGAEAILAAEFDRHQDLHSAAWYLFITCSRAFGYFLDIICLLFIICVTFGCLTKYGVESSTVGLAITQSISLTGIFQWGMRQSAEMENQMTSVERVVEYTRLPQEDAWRSEEGKEPPVGWPDKGGIEFKDASLRYIPNGDVILKHLNLTILPREKIGIVGRTGAGKSTVIQALFRLGYLEGTIAIDGVDISTVGLHDLRHQISIIPQEPVLFSGTLRKNLDPFGEYSDERLMDALQGVEMCTEDQLAETLNKEVSEGGVNFSVGERQLVCLARAVVRRNNILVMDEATANVDAATDALIQSAIRQHFTDCTVLTIAHRLNTIIDSDKVLVLDAGAVVEFDHPFLLLQNKRSLFRRMVRQTGATMTSLLYKTAARNYKARQKSTDVPETSPQ